MGGLKPHGAEEGRVVEILSAEKSIMVRQRKLWQNFPNQYKIESMKDS